MRPDRNEYNEYYQTYVDCVPDSDVVEFLGNQRKRMRELISAVPEDLESFRYADGKWSTKEVFGHVLDAEWVFVYRALRIARNDKTPLAGMDQDRFIAGANFEDRTLASIGKEFDAVRSAAIELFSSFSPEILIRTGKASGYPFSVRALIYVVAGHVEHHIRIISERYL